eukprot:CAMPEP_0202475214 /NCGR_PEP_ID=MMETSP1360-20130828/92783_1 /ASSEMBLY_ACC=CAM_ASM_000848 /TAXON_ID=515479 /ORGANISM="Licmophora paradoxa, Strain CCMP2313" /LENGTH=305 /DNA_ID=CAMNT_0049102361 /DNA_START=211 /DNA_END=1129 /DNA_ORIENTATION=+
MGLQLLKDIFSINTAASAASASAATTASAAATTAVSTTANKKNINNQSTPSIVKETKQKSRSSTMTNTVTSPSHEQKRIDRDDDNDEDEDDLYFDPAKGFIRCPTFSDQASSCRNRINAVLPNVMNGQLHLSEEYGVCVFHFAENSSVSDHFIVLEVPPSGQFMSIYAVVRRIAYYGDNNSNNNSNSNINERSIASANDTMELMEYALQMNYMKKKPGVLINERSIASANDTMELMEYALQMNYMKQETRGACLCINDDELTLSYTHPVCAIDQNELQNILDNFHDTLVEVSEKLEARFPTMRSG